MKYHHWETEQITRAIDLSLDPQYRYPAGSQNRKLSCLGRINYEAIAQTLNEEYNTRDITPKGVEAKLNAHRSAKPTFKPRFA